MKGLRYFLVLATSIGVASSLSASSKKEALNFDAISKLVPGHVTKADLTKLLGKPDETLDFSKEPNSRSKDVEWTYRQNGQDRAAFTFDEGSDSLKEWTWMIHDGEAEQKLQNAKQRFQGGRWEAQTERWINPHFFPMECFYRDETKGVSLLFNLRRREVSRITRWNPERKIASDSGEKPPEYCLGAESKCTPAIPAKEFFKDQSVEKYCQETH